MPALPISAERGTKIVLSTHFGEVAERLNAPDLKSGIEVTLSGVQIPPSPPFIVILSATEPPAFKLVGALDEVEI
jgi:hypothetical protein